MTVAITGVLRKQGDPSQGPRRCVWLWAHQALPQAGEQWRPSGLVVIQGRFD